MRRRMHRDGRRSGFDTSSTSVRARRWLSVEPYAVAMVKEGTPGKYQLRAVLPGSRRPFIEIYASLDGVAARRAALEQAGYNVLVTFGEILQLAGHRRARDADPEDLEPSSHG